MRNVFLLIASLIIALAASVWQDTAVAQIVPVTNIEIRMLKTSTKPPLRVTADTRNPNDFAVRDIEVECTIKDKAGKNLATYTSIIYGVFQPNQHSITKSLNIGAWPEQGYAALCVSKRGMRVTPAAASAPPTAPGPTTPPPPAPQSSAQPAPTAPAAARQ